MISEIDMKNDLLVVGLGNPLVRDEGVGNKIVERLAAEADNFLNTDITDGGTGGITLLHLMANRKKVIIIDCANMREEPGTIKRFTPDDVKSVKQLSHLSLHEIDIMQVLEMSRKLGELPEKIVIFGIQPEILEDSIGLTEVISNNLCYYLELIRKEIKA